MKLILGLAVLGVVLAAFLRSFWNPPSQEKDGSEKSSPYRFGGTWPDPKSEPEKEEDGS